MAFRAACETAEDGQFLAVIDPSSESVVVIAAGFRAGRVALLADVEDLGDIRLDPGGTIAGRVVDERGVEVSGARVSCSAPANRVGWPHGERTLSVAMDDPGNVATTGADGAFACSGLDPRGSYEVAASRDGYTIMEGRQLARPGGPAVTVTLTPVAVLAVEPTIEGTDATADDGQVPALHVVASVEPPTDFGVVALRPDPAEYAASPVQQAVHRFVLRRAAEPGQDPQAAVVDLEVSADGFKLIREVVAIPWGTTRTLRPRLVLADGVALVPVDVRVRGARGAEFTGTLLVSFFRDGAGTAAVARVEIDAGAAIRPVLLAAGTYRAMASGTAPAGTHWHPASDLSASFVVGPTTSSLCELVVRGAAVPLEVVDEVGRAVPGYDLLFERVGDASLRAVHFAYDAEFARDAFGVVPRGTHGPFVWLPPGRYRFRASVEGLGLAEAPVDVPDDGVASPVVLRVRTDVAPIDFRERIRSMRGK
ncbi:MAG: carboxypeptidase regulatory-like domain-containing protein [Planctomycetia bacterium]|nr:carboxypeptidase regulatory-like domain-containing protein [Planctomycetia bacterium]